jgi:hypothetical protein
MIEFLLPCGFDTLEYTWVKATIGIYTLADYSMATKHQQAFWRVAGKPVNSIYLYGRHDTTSKYYWSL